MEKRVDELEALVGQELGVSSWITVDQEMISAFGGSIAHGFLTLSLISRCAIEALPTVAGEKMGINYGFNKMRFLHPVASGKRIRGRFTLDKLIRKGEGQILQEFGLSIEIEGVSSPALIAKWLTMTYFEEVPA